MWEDTDGHNKTSIMAFVGEGSCRKIMGKTFGPQKGHKHAKHVGERRGVQAL